MFENPSVEARTYTLDTLDESSGSETNKNWAYPLLQDFPSQSSLAQRSQVHFAPVF